MALQKLEDGWYRFGAGKRWRCIGPGFLCEVGEEGAAPDFLRLSRTVSGVRRVKDFYRGKLSFGALDAFGYGLDVLVANSFTESLGSVPSRLSLPELEGIHGRSAGTDAEKLDAVVRYISGAGGERYLERREPGYVNPAATPGRVSLGSHHILLSTALSLAPPVPGKGTLEHVARIKDLACSLPANSRLAAEYAIRYFNKAHARHLNQPPLLAAAYNAGSPRLTTANPWNLVQYGEHIDRWIAYFNTSRKL